MPTPALAYLRVSGASQIEGTGFDRQQEACDNYAAAHGLQIANTYREEGVSGRKDLENRPALQELLMDIETSEVRTIIIERLDRLARDLMVQETILGDLRKRGITLISVAEPDLCSDDPSRKLVRQIFGAIAEYDRAMIVLKLQAARRRVTSKVGRCEGRKPYGHYAGENAALLLIRELRASGGTLRDIAAEMNIRAIPARHGSAWSTGSIGKILAREHVAHTCAAFAPTANSTTGKIAA